jgi:hypothetical protein
MLVGSAALIAAVAVYRDVPMSRRFVVPKANYGRVFADLHNRGIHTVSVVEGGIRNSEGLVAYEPRLRFYQLLWQTRALSVREIAPDVATLTKRPGTVVVTCDPNYVGELRRYGTPLGAIRGCISVRLTSG